MKKWLLFTLLLAGCSHYKTTADCHDICRKHGQRFVKVVTGTADYDPVERKERKTYACKCE